MYQKLVVMTKKKQIMYSPDKELPESILFILLLSHSVAFPNYSMLGELQSRAEKSLCALVKKITVRRFKNTDEKFLSTSFVYDP